MTPLSYQGINLEKLGYLSRNTKGPGSFFGFLCPCSRRQLFDLTSRHGDRECKKRARAEQPRRERGPAAARDRMMVQIRQEEGDG